MKSIDNLRKSLKDCTTEAGIEPNKFDTYWITADACDHLIDEIEAEIAANYLELPVDADGNRVKFGDKLHEDEDGHEFVVSGFKVWGDSFEWWAYQENGVQAPLERCHIVKPDPLKELLNDHLQEREKIVRKLESSLITLGEAESEEDACDKLYADRIRELLLGGDAE